MLDGTRSELRAVGRLRRRGPSAAAINYLNVFGVIQGITSEQIADFNVTGTAWRDGLEDSLGERWRRRSTPAVEYRKESLELNPDQSFQTGDLAGQGAPTLPVSGNFKVKEVFGEMQMPIVQHSFIDELTFSAGYRKSWYKTSAPAASTTRIPTSWPGEFAPISDIRFRVAYNRAVRAPNIQELFAPQFVGSRRRTDPCAATGSRPRIMAVSRRACGRSVAVNPAAQYNGLLGGNPDFARKRATTKTLGVVLQPRFIPRFAPTVDCWDIKLKDAIQGFGADAILADCVASRRRRHAARPAISSTAIRPARSG